ncbi:MAG: hypothetical protein VYA80_08010, partial [Pseudomonadota bacterium]|nr:hypothetical protein [Pseudomonadota bacterium]
DSQPVVIDFGTALRRDGGFLDHFFFRIISRSDFNAWIKLKYAKNYNAISAEDMKWFRPNAFELTLRILRRFWQIISFRKIRKRWKKR